MGSFRAHLDPRKLGPQKITIDIGQGLGRSMRPIVELGDVVVNFGSERPLVVIGGSELSLGREVGLSDETSSPAP